MDREWKARRVRPETERQLITVSKAMVRRRFGTWKREDLMREVKGKAPWGTVRLCVRVLKKAGLVKPVTPQSTPGGQVFRLASQVLKSKHPEAKLAAAILAVRQVKTPRATTVERHFIRLRLQDETLQAAVVLGLATMGLQRKRGAAKARKKA